MSIEDQMLIQYESFWSLYFPKILKCGYNGLSEVFLDEADAKEARQGGTMPVGYFPPGLCYFKRCPIAIYTWTGDWYKLKRVFIPKKRR